MAAVPSMELVQSMTQQQADHFHNGAVPEFMLFLIGPDLGGAWTQVEDALAASQGPGNSGKTFAAHIPGSPENTVIQVERLAMESESDGAAFSAKSATLDMRICTAHGMPPQLANIALPGKMGAANEGPNAMLTFQQRKLGQCQRAFSRMFAQTLGSGLKFLSPASESSKTIAPEMFLADDVKADMEAGDLPIFNQKGNGFNTILDGMTLGAQDTLSRMREPIAGSSRNPADGTLGGSRDRRPEDPARRRD
jgi:hypothetical protein